MKTGVLIRLEWRIREGENPVRTLRSDAGLPQSRVA